MYSSPLQEGEEEVLTGSLGMAFCGTLQHSRKKPARVSGPRTAPVLHQLVRTLDSTIKRGSALYSSHHNLGYLQQAGHSDFHVFISAYRCVGLHCQWDIAADFFKLQGSSVSHNMEDRGADRGADRSESRPLHCISPGLRGMAVTATALT
ncbi:hypothetical protein F7725_009838 [Dissostichus mawsoni]|uniref:Uncharacterized protein n=1 Tax=Dissostichus mawsoni TaxID=36200 RepID=A0A7J5XM49_DISMA|nr:hypothetical protein F7725_009838 [Dissostichus mawsoni]